MANSSSSNIQVSIEKMQNEATESTSLLFDHAQPNQREYNKNSAIVFGLNFQGCFSLLDYILDILVRTSHNNARSLHELDGIRALSFIWVYTTHCTLLNPAYIDNSSYIEFPNTYLRNLAQVGYQGVTCFFVLSGFLIPMALVSRFKKSDDKAAFNIKIAPCLWVTLAIAMIYGKYSGDSKSEEYMYTVCESGFWSVSVEMQLYIFSAIPVYFYLKKPCYGWIFVIIWIIAVVIARFAVLAYILENEDDDSTYGLYEEYFQFIYKNTFLRADAYAIGMGTYMFWEWLKTQKDNDINPLITCTPLALAIMLVTSTVVIVTPYFLNSCAPIGWLEITYGGSNPSSYTPSYLYFACLTDLVVALDTACIVLMVITTGKNQQDNIFLSFTTTREYIYFILKYCYCTFCWLMGKILSSSFLYPVASLSYTAYLLTEPAIRMYMNMVLYKWVNQDTLGDHTLLAVLVYFLEFLVLLGLSFLLSLFVERPFMRFGSLIKVRLL